MGPIIMSPSYQTDTTIITTAEQDVLVNPSSSSKKIEQRASSVRTTMWKKVCVAALAGTAVVAGTSYVSNPSSSPANLALLHSDEVSSTHEMTMLAGAAAAPSCTYPQENISIFGGFNDV